jgi:hypothetical protein
VRAPNGLGPEKRAGLGLDPSQDALIFRRLGPALVEGVAAPVWPERWIRSPAS